MSPDPGARFRAIFPRPPLIGMVHLLPLPGSPGWGGSMASVLERAVADAGALGRAGFDAVLVENFGDAPFYPDSVPPETLAALAVCVAAVVGAAAVPVGVNVLRNDAAGGLAICAAAGARFIRVNVHAGVMLADQGILQGRAWETVRLRDRLCPDAAVLADILVKHAVPPPGVETEQLAADTFRRGRADALIVTGSGTGREVDRDRLALVKRAVPEAPVLVGSGVTAPSAQALLARCDGLIVGSALSHGGAAGNGVDPDRAGALVRSARG